MQSFIAAGLGGSVMPLSSVIAILADGQFHSGESLGTALGITRAGVWKRLQGLTALGIAVESVKGRGYRVPGGLSLLSESTITAGLSADAQQLLAALSCLHEVDSTNQYLLRDGAARGDVCLAERQSAGRGRRGRVWRSPFGQNLYLSLRWQYEQGVAALEGLSLAVGAIVAQVLEQSFDVAGLQLKWPNDLLLHGRKLGGVLIEVGGDLTGDCAVVVGVGLNVAMSRAVGTEAIDQPWTDLLMQGHSIDRNHLAGALLSQLLPALAAYPQLGFGHYRQTWLQHAAYIGREVEVTMPGRNLSGIMRGVDSGGSLVVEAGGQQHTFVGGEVSLRAT